MSLGKRNKRYLCQACLVLFHSECKLNLFSETIYIYCVNPAMPKSLKSNSNFT